MMRVVLLALACLPLAGPLFAQPGQPNYPLMKLKCVTAEAQEGSPFNSPSALVFIPSPFKITNSDKRLKFYESLIAFEGGRTYQLAQPRITEADMNNKSGRFGDLKARQGDDDIPTSFTADGIVYELQTVTGFPIKERISDKSFKIDMNASIRVSLEVVTDTVKRAPPVWTGNCVLTNVVESI
jgi:hypothetical protein